MKTNKKGFTLIEILVAVLIIGVLASIAIPTYRKSVEKAKAAEAVAIINDTAKAEQDFAIVSNRYTTHWEDLILNHINIVPGTVYCIKGTNAANQEDCGSESSYKVSLSVGTPEDSVVVATRTPNNPYADYKLFKFMNGDPNIYCRSSVLSPTDICAVLGFPTKNLPGPKNVALEEDFSCADRLPDCNTRNYGCLSDADSFSCVQVTYDDGSYDHNAYYPNGDIYDVFTYDANGNLTSDTWFKDNGDISGISFYDGNGASTKDIGFSDNETNYLNIRTWSNGKWSELTDYYSDGSISTYRSYDFENNRWAYFAEYNQDGSVKNFTCYTTSICGGSCSGAECASSPYASNIPNPATLKPYTEFLSAAEISKICSFPNSLTICS